MDRFKVKTFFLVFTLNFRKNFSHVREVLENKESGKRHQIWAKLYCFPNFFDWYAYDYNDFYQYTINADFFMAVFRIFAFCWYNRLK